MTREQARTYLMSSGMSEDQIQTVEDAFTCKDAISRAELLKAIDTWDKFGCDSDTKLVPYQDHYIPYIHYDDVVKAIKGMPSVTPTQKNTLENTLENTLGDAISREEVLELIADYDLSMGQVVKGIHALPSVTPKPKTGNWIMDRQLERRTCDNCNTKYRWSFYPHNYCPNCGADMRGAEE